MVRRLPPAVAACVAGLFLIPTSLSRGDEMQVCTLIGCESGVTVDISAYRIRHPQIRRVVVCVDRHCEVRKWSRTTHAPDVVEVRTAEPRAHSAVVKVVAYDSRGLKRIRKLLNVFLRKIQPNGPRCEPICFAATVRVSRHGRLRVAAY
jgi:hypothetical protein